MIGRKVATRDGVSRVSFGEPFFVNGKCLRVPIDLMFAVVGFGIMPPRRLHVVALFCLCLRSGTDRCLALRGYPGWSGFLRRPCVPLFDLTRPKYLMNSLLFCSLSRPSRFETGVLAALSARVIFIGRRRVFRLPRRPNNQQLEQRCGPLATAVRPHPHRPRRVRGRQPRGRSGGERGAPPIGTESQR